MMMCDLTVAAADALFGEPEIRFSNVGPALIMPFVIGLKRSRELLYLGDPIDAQTALQYGMVNRVVPRADLTAATMNSHAGSLSFPPRRSPPPSLPSTAEPTPPASATPSAPVSTCWPRSMRRGRKSG